MTAKRLNIQSGSPYEAVFGYCRAVRFGDQVHVAGTCAPAGNEQAGTYEQARAALAVIGEALGKAGCGFEDVVRTVVYVKDIAEADEVARAHSETFAAIRPASTMVQVTAMLRPWHRVEIEAYAIVGARF
ncbi:MAG: RidA family protein [Methylobacteriaceae bacterium]|nr:RidA family protein [Methylobacteriaceae bacterium]